MKKFVVIIFSLLIPVLFTACSIFRATPDVNDINLESLHPMLKLSESEASKVYSQQLDSAMNHPKKADYEALRMAFTRTSDYQPYSDNEHLSKIKSLLDDEEYTVASEVVKTVYHKLFHVPIFHFYAYVAWKETGNSKMAQIHSLYYNQLIKSILQSGDGTSAASAYIIINVSEEYRVIEYLDMKMQSQKLITKNGHYFDLMDVKDSTGNKSSVYFNIDIPFSELQ
ncbi:MAG: DUF4919 domain-containing protein [Candidatus Delongbacteria bacterium]|jgi:hypothetical protein|nr:DUF4919 domain-containing protein [Candidatus Delongbacteria bacterium]